MKHVTKLFSAVLAVAMLVGMMSNAFAATAYCENTDEVVSQYVAALNENDWNTIIEMSPEEDYQENIAFYCNENNENNSIGFLSIREASLSTIIELESSNLCDYTNADYYFTKYGALKLYLVGLELSVSNESKYFYNGVNFFLVTLGQEDGRWKVVLFSQAPASVIEENMSTAQVFADDDNHVDSSDVSKALEIIRARYQGIILDGEGNVIGTNIATTEEIAEEKGADFANSMVSAQANTDLTRPSTIAVYRTSTGKIEPVEFYKYCKNVLPNEWIGSWNAESLKAGAQAVKFVAWYRVYNAKYPGKGYDVKDSTADQVYKENTEYSTCTDAINAVGGIGMLSSSGELFYPSYRAGTSGSAGTQSGGTMSQYGSQYLAKQGYTYDEILSYYYSYSNVSSGAITTFSY